MMRRTFEELEENRDERLVHQAGEEAERAPVEPLPVEGHTVQITTSVGPGLDNLLVTCSCGWLSYTTTDHAEAERWADEHRADPARRATR